MSVCVCVAYFLFLFICATADSRGEGARRFGKYLSEADLCCLEAQHFKPSLSCAHKYQNSSLCCFPAPNTNPACCSKRPLLLRLLATTEELCKFIWPSHCPFAVARLPPHSSCFPLADVRRVEAAKLHWIIASAVCLFQLGLLDDIPPTWYTVVSRFTLPYSPILLWSLFPTLSILSVPVPLIARYLFEAE